MSKFTNINLDNLPHLDEAKEFYNEKTAAKTVRRVFEDWHDRKNDSPEVAAELKKINKRLDAIEIALNIKKMEGDSPP